jgi:hypothetical protein
MMEDEENRETISRTVEVAEARLVLSEPSSEARMLVYPHA